MNKILITSELKFNCYNLLVKYYFPNLKVDLSMKETLPRKSLINVGIDINSFEILVVQVLKRLITLLAVEYLDNCPGVALGILCSASLAALSCL